MTDIQRQSDNERDRQTYIQRQTQTERQRDTQTYIYNQKNINRDREQIDKGDTDIHRQRQTNIHI